MSTKKISAEKKTPARLPAALIKNLGRIPLSRLAAQFGVAPERIRLEKARRNIPWAVPRPAWNKKQLALLGTASDERIAEKLGLVKSAVSARRWKLGIAPFCETRETKTHHWTKKELGWLGKLKDVEIGRRIGLSAPSVAWKRRSLGIGQSSQQGQTCRKWTKQELALLGKTPDTVIASQLKIHRHQVGLKRQELGIATFKLKAKPTTQIRRVSTAVQKSTSSLDPGKQISWNAKLVARLGREPDAKVARDLGVSVKAVAARRRALGIKGS